MKTTSASFAEHLAEQTTTRSMCLLIVRKDGVAIALTTHDQDLPFNLAAAMQAVGLAAPSWIIAAGQQTYLAAVGGTLTDVESNSQLNVDNVEIHGLLSTSGINEADLGAGLYDDGRFIGFEVNWAAYRTISSLTRSGAVATAHTDLPHGLATGDLRLIAGALEGAYNGDVTVTVTDATHFTYPVSGSPTTPATGAPFASMGMMIIRAGRLGKFTIGRRMYQAELRGMADAFNFTMLKLDAALCQHDLGDAGCKVDLTGGTGDSPPIMFTGTGTLTSVNPDGFTLYDTARTEPGPPAGIAITGVSNANPGRVTMAGPWAFKNFDTVVIAGVVGPALVNQTAVIRDLSGNSFSIGIDTTDTAVYPAYISGGTVAFLSASGFFAGGKMTILTSSGAGLGNVGISMDVKAYTEGQITLQLPLPYPCQVGDTYSIVAGCDKTRPTCRDRYNNIANSDAVYDLPGHDRLFAVGRRT